MSNKDYIIFDKAPKINFTYDSQLYPFDSWYTNVDRDTEKPRIPGFMTTSDCPSDFVLNNVEVEYVRVRGNYTTNFCKKPLKIKFTEKQGLFGLNKDKKAKEWILLADYGDNSMSRNALTFYIGQQILRTQWSATFTYVQVYANNQYLGLYLLCDQKEVGKNRVNVNEPEKTEEYPEGYPGVDVGYFFERDDYYTPQSEDPGFIIHKEAYPSEYSPDYLPLLINHETDKYYAKNVSRNNKDGYTIHSHIYSENQINFLKRYTCLIYTIIYEACINNNFYELTSFDTQEWETWSLFSSELTDPKEVVSKVIDLDSFVDMYILQEIVGNPDLAHSSFYMCLDASSEGDLKLRLTCPWDFDRALGLCDGLSNPDQTELWAKGAHGNPWICLLAQTDWFVDLLKQRWQELYDDYFMRKSLNLIKDYSDTYSEDFAKNYQLYSIRWENESGGKTDPKNTNSINPDFYQDVQTQADCEVLLRTWYNQRLCCLHSLLDGQGSTDWPEPPVPPVPPVPPGPDPHHKDIPIWEKANNEHRYQFRGLSTDPKPSRDTWVNLGNGSILIEMDTAKLFMYDEENDVWYEL